MTDKVEGMKPGAIDRRNLFGVDYALTDYEGWGKGFYHQYEVYREVCDNINHNAKKKIINLFAEGILKEGGTLRHEDLI